MNIWVSTAVVKKYCFVTLRIYSSCWKKLQFRCFFTAELTVDMPNFSALFSVVLKMELLDIALNEPGLCCYMPLGSYAYQRLSSCWDWQLRRE